MFTRPDLHNVWAVLFCICLRRCLDNSSALIDLTNTTGLWYVAGLSPYVCSSLKWIAKGWLQSSVTPSVVALNRSTSCGHRNQVSLFFSNSGPSKTVLCIVSWKLVAQIKTFYFKLSASWFTGLCAVFSLWFFTGIQQYTEFSSKSTLIKFGTPK